MGRTHFWVVFLTSWKKKFLLIPIRVKKKKKKKEMSREGESSVSFKTWVLGSRRRGEQPRLIKQRAGRSKYRLLTQESPFTCLKLDQRHG